MTFFLDLVENEDFFERWTLEAPQGPGIVNDSERGWLMITGDLLGPALDVSYAMRLW